MSCYKKTVFKPLFLPSCQIDTIRFLVNAGADKSAVNHNSQSAVHLAVTAASVDVLNVLMELGFDVNIKVVLTCYVFSSSSSSSSFSSSSSSFSSRLLLFFTFVYVLCALPNVNPYSFICI